jgi:uncharacterized peroxidase-related enzyme
MPRIQPVRLETAEPRTAEILGAVKKKLGSVPNLIATMAQAPAVVNAYLGFSQALSSGSLPARLREQIALVVGQTNDCDYCLAAHSAIGRKVGLSATEVEQARRGTADDARTAAALDFARKVVKERGRVTDEDVNQVRQAGYSDGEIGEIVANVVENIFTNYFNHVAATEIDFPATPKLSRGG